MDDENSTIEENCEIEDEASVADFFGDADDLEEEIIDFINKD